MARLLGLVVNQGGHPGAAPAVYVANHISWIDIVAISVAAPVLFIAKSELQRWPAISPLTSWSGAVFVRRGGVAGLADTLVEAVALLKNGRSEPASVTAG
ncbi:MAG: 1-acyl-sn-glycerol-3-phosphate acyltransferase [Pseudomonadota bacterium]|nr:MAG: 1-acyl-sn-glycerol-3-phosphate acyltransferase [Pseudomonadota bacterium]